MEDFIIGRDSKNAPIRLYDVVYTTGVDCERKYYLVVYDTHTFGFRAYEFKTGEVKTIVATNVFTKTKHRPIGYEEVTQEYRNDYLHAIVQKG